MRILLAGPRGFCAGVNMAIESLEAALERFGVPVYVYHEIVHNQWVVSQFEQRGVVFVDDLSQVPPGGNVLYSAHGVSPEIRKQARERNLRTIDATCPLVTKVHREAMSYARKGYTIILIGHRGHDEVVGTMGEVDALSDRDTAPKIVLVANRDDVDRLEVPNAERLAYLTQTTLSVDDAAEIVARLRERFPAIVGPAKDDICYATQNRQEAVRELSAEADMALIVGSGNSSNSVRLAELAAASGLRTHLIDGAGDIDPAWFSGDETVLITAGASAPETVVQDCVRVLCERFQASIENRSLREENVRFLLPKGLRDLAVGEGEE
jgi:4-hydroxy-3-methylbut-2-enyl diphosphate reductase